MQPTEERKTPSSDEEEPCLICVCVCVFVFFFGGGSPVPLPHLVFFGMLLNIYTHTKRERDKRTQTRTHKALLTNDGNSIETEGAAKVLFYEELLYDVRA